MYYVYILQSLKRKNWLYKGSTSDLKRRLEEHNSGNLGKKRAKKENPGRIQVDEKKFILPPRDIYHNCKPNAFIDWDSMNLKALEVIPIGAMVTYHYGTSEDDYRIGAFHCVCGNIDCVKHFEGLKYMVKEQRDKIKKMLSPFLKKKYYLK